MGKLKLPSGPLPFLNEVEELALENQLLRKKIDINRAKLQAAEEMAKAIKAAESHYAMICEALCADNPPPGGYPVLEQLRCALTAWEKTGKEA